MMLVAVVLLEKADHGALFHRVVKGVPVCLCRNYPGKCPLCSRFGEWDCPITTKKQKEETLELNGV
jgi:hypothetical protein